MNITDIKHCSKCKQHKPRDQFGNTVMTKDGKQGWCKQCMKLHRAVKKQSELLHVEPVL